MSRQYEVEGPPSDAISSVSFSPDGTAIAVSSWDCGLRIYQKSSEAPQAFDLHTHFTLPAPVLDACWNSSNTICSVGLDHTVRSIPIGEMGNVSVSDHEHVKSIHESASNKVVVSDQHGLILSTSWDGIMHVHYNDAYIAVRLAGKPFALSLTTDRAVVAMAERKVSVYDLNALKQLVEQTGGTASGQQPLEIQPWQERESNLKFMTRAAACMPDGTGFATSSIEGRVSVEWFDPEAQKNTYAFKCHRKASKTQDEDGNEQDVDIVYPVNALAFHPVHGTFVTGGGDGVVTLWDAKTKRRVKQYPQLGASVAGMAFSPDGMTLAIGVSPGFEDGKEDEEVDQSQVKVVIRELSENETKGKAPKT